LPRAEPGVLLAQATPGTLARETQPKVRGVLVLEAALRSHAPEVRFVVLFSSMAAVLGGYGMAAYAAANRFMDAFASEKVRHGRARVCRRPSGGCWCTTPWRSRQVLWLTHSCRRPSGGCWCTTRGDVEAGRRLVYAMLLSRTEAKRAGAGYRRRSSRWRAAAARCGKDPIEPPPPPIEF
jgi:hypothetical protein